jgi:hypothetical protein
LSILDAMFKYLIFIQLLLLLLQDIECKKQVPSFFVLKV